MTLSTLLRHSKTHRQARSKAQDLYYWSLEIEHEDTQGKGHQLAIRALAALRAAQLPVLNVNKVARWTCAGRGLVEIVVAAPIDQRMPGLVAEGWRWMPINRGYPESHQRVTRANLEAHLSRG